MKKFYLIGMFAAAALLTACDNEEKFTPAPHEGVLRATVEGNNVPSRAGFTPAAENNFYWSKSDQIGVTTSTSLNSFSALTLKDEFIGQATGSFDGVVSGTIQGYAVYPFNEGHSIDQSILTYHLKSDYSYTHVDADYTTDVQGEGNSFNPPMWGIINDGNVRLKHLGGVFCIKIGKLPVGNNLNLILTSNEKISGTYDNIDLSSPEPQINAVDASTESEKTVTITFSNNTDNVSGVFYIPAPLGTHTLRLKVLDGETEKINSVLGTYNISRRLLKKLETSNESISAGEYVAVENADEVKNKLLTEDYIAVKNVANNSSVEIPSVNSGDISKTVAFEKVVGTLTVEDAAAGGTSVKNLTLAFAKDESSSNPVKLTLNTPNTTSTLQATGGDFNFEEVTANTAENTLIVDKGVRIAKLIVKKGNVNVKAGAVVEVIENNTGTTLQVFQEEGATVPTPKQEDHFFIVSSSAEYDLRKIAKNGGTATLSSNIVLSSPLVVEKEMMLDLNGYSIKPIDGKLIKVLNTQDAVVLVRRGAVLTIKDSKSSGSIDSENNTNILATIKLTDTNDGKTGDLAELIVNGGSIKGESFAISGNGTRENTQLTITAGTISSRSDFAIYSPQAKGITEISGGTITGAGGAIALQNGELTISGEATLISEGTAVYQDAEGDGTRRLQNAPVCVPARYGDCIVTISGGIFNAKGDSKGIDITYDKKEEGHQRTISITGGTFFNFNPMGYVADGYEVKCEGVVTTDPYVGPEIKEYVVSKKVE